MILTVIQPDEACPLDRFDPWLRAAAPDLEVRTVRPFAGEAVPQEPGDALRVLGGTMHAPADADHPWLVAVRALIADAVAAGTPTLGVCLGAQLLAVATGGRVQVAAPPGVEAGVVEVIPRPAVRDDALLAPFAADVPADNPLNSGVLLVMPSMHHDAVVELPATATWLASSRLYPYQAFRVGARAWGLQFHPEAAPGTVAAWAAPHEGLDPEAVRAEVEAADDRIAADGARLAAQFMALARG